MKDYPTERATPTTTPVVAVTILGIVALLALLAVGVYVVVHIGEVIGLGSGRWFDIVAA